MKDIVCSVFPRPISSARMPFTLSSYLRHPCQKENNNTHQQTIASGKAKTKKEIDRMRSLQLDQPVQAGQLIVPHLSVLDVRRSLREGDGTAALNGLGCSGYIM
jgi:hypothetical protein